MKIKTIKQMREVLPRLCQERGITLDGINGRQFFVHILCPDGTLRLWHWYRGNTQQDIARTLDQWANMVVIKYPGESEEERSRRLSRLL